MNNNELPVNITQENYEQVMFNLLEGLYSPSTERELLQKINADPLFRFEWEQWQKSRITQIEIPDLGDEAYWNSVKAISKNETKVISIWGAGKMLRIAAILLPLLITGILLWLNTGNKKTPHALVNNNNKQNTNTVSPSQLQSNTNNYADKGNKRIINVVDKRNAGVVNTPVEVVKNSKDTVLKAPAPQVLNQTVKAPVIAKTEQVNPARKKRFNVMVSNITPEPEANTSIASEKPKKISKLFTNPQIRKYKTESGEVWIEISGDGGSVYAKAAESIEK